MVAPSALVDYGWRSGVDASQFKPDRSLKLTKSDSPPDTVKLDPAPLVPREPRPTDAREDTDRRARLLLRAVAAGRPEAFWSLWALYRDDLFKLCLRSVGSVRADAEDALSIAMLRAFDRLPVYAAEIRNVRGWLGTLTINLCIDIHRDRRLEAQYCDRTDYSECALSEAASDPVSPESILLDTELRRCLDLAVESLPAALYEPIKLYFSSDMTYASVGKRLGITPPNARKRIQRALVMLNARLRRLTA